MNLVPHNTVPKNKPLLKLKAIRIEHNITQAKAAKMLNISTVAYIKKESGIESFTLDEITLLSQIIKPFGIF